MYVWQKFRRGRVTKKYTQTVTYTFTTVLGKRILSFGFIREKVRLCFFSFSTPRLYEIVLIQTDVYEIVFAWLERLILFNFVGAQNICFKQYYSSARNRDTEKGRVLFTRMVSFHFASYEQLVFVRTMKFNFKLLEHKKYIYKKKKRQETKHKSKIKSAYRVL